MRKGISPLVAAVILIAATMSIAGILSFWASGFVKTRLGEAGNVTVESSCLGAEFKLHSGSYDNETLTLIVDNIRPVDLVLESLYLFYPDKPMIPKSLNNTILKGNEIKQIQITDVDTNFTSAKIKTNCPEVYLDFTFSQVIG